MRTFEGSNSTESQRADSERFKKFRADHLSPRFQSRLKVLHKLEDRK